MARVEFRVMRAHFGDKPYSEGDTRIADEMRVRHLVSAGVLAKPDALHGATLDKRENRSGQKPRGVPSTKVPLRSDAVKVEASQGKTGK